MVTLLVSPFRLRQQLLHSELAPSAPTRRTARRVVAAAVGAASGFATNQVARLRRGAPATEVVQPESNRHKHLYRMYARPGWLREQYEGWFTHIESVSPALPVVSSLVVRRLDDGETTVFDDWRSALEQYPDDRQRSSAR